MISSGTTAQPDGVPMSTPIDCLLNSSLVNQDSDLSDVLGRPYVIASGSISASSSDDIHVSDWPDKFFSQTNFLNKVRGFTALRGRVKFVLSVTAPPEVAGMLMMHYFPYGQYMENRERAVNASTTGRTGCPNVKLDLRTSSEAVLEMEMVSPHMAYNLATGQGSFGRLRVTKYSPIRDVGNVGVLYTLTATLLDGQLYMPTNTDVVTSSAVSRFLDTTVEGYEVVETDVVAQIGDEATDLMVQVAQATSSIAKAAGTLAPLFGLSKPHTQQLPVINRPRFMNCAVNVDGVDTGVPLGPSYSTALSDVPGMFGSMEDDMLVKNVVSRSQFLDRLTYSKTDSSGKILNSYKVAPQYARSNFSYDAATEISSADPTHLFALSRCFGMWRGTLVYSVRVVSTVFHKGRLRLSWTPGGKVGNTFLPYDMTKSIVFDISTTEPIEFEIPYAHTRPWRQTCAFSGQGDNSFVDDYNGIFVVSVYEPLRCPSTVSSDVHVIVEVCGVKDIAFCNPILPRNIGFQVPAVTVTTTREEGPIIYAQIGGEVVDSNEIYTASLTHGESSPSLRPYIKMFASGNFVDFPAEKMLYIEPWATHQYGYGEWSEKSELRFPQTPVNFISYFYTFWRGSKRFKLVSPSDTQVIVFSIRNANPQTHSQKERYKSIDYAPYFVAHPSFVHDFGKEGPLEFTVPSSGLSHIYPVLEVDTNLTVNGVVIDKAQRAARSGYIPTTAVVVGNAFPNTGDGAKMRVFEAAGDDFGFGFLVGLPRVQYSAIV